MPSVRAAYLVGRTLVVLDDGTHWSTATWGDVVPLAVRADGTVAPYELVESAWVRDGYLYLVLTRPGRMGSGSPPVPHLRRFPLDTAGVPAEFPDDGYLVPIYPQPDAAFQRDGDLYLMMSGARYARVPADRAVDGSPDLTAIGNSWVDLPAEVASQVTGSLDADAALFLFLEGRYLKFPKDVAVQRPFELAIMPREIVRLTSGTAATLNQLLLAGGVPALPRRRRRRSTRPRGSARTGTATRRPPTRPSPCRPPRSRSTAARQLAPRLRERERPLLLGDLLSRAAADRPGAQRGPALRRGAPVVRVRLRPGRRPDWRFLPFLAVDVDALIARLGELRAAADALWPGNRTLGKLVGPVLDDLTTVAPAMRTHGGLSTAQDEALDRLASTAVVSALAAAERKADTPALRAALHHLQETAGVVTGLRRHDRTAILRGWCRPTGTTRSTRTPSPSCDPSPTGGRW